MIDKSAVNRMLMSKGLGKLNDPGLIPQLGFLVARVVATHDDFRGLIEKCEPAQRNNMYEAMRPYLRFEAKPLDVYVAEIGMRAQSQRLPVVAPDGSFIPHKPAEIKTGELGVAQSAVERSFSKFHLTLLCRQCTREQTFCGAFRDDCVRQARAAGWRMRLERKPLDRFEPDEMKLEAPAKLVETIQYELCPKCAG